MQGIFVDNRKRSREEDTDSTPLSKRINNLHLNNYDEQNSSTSSSSNSRELLSSILESQHNEQQQQQQYKSADQPMALLKTNPQTKAASAITPNGVNNVVVVDCTDAAALAVDMGMVALNLSMSHMNAYNPELNEAQNPFYYDKNKLLHELHFERLKRQI